jgi:hypothetical protein
MKLAIEWVKDQAAGTPDFLVGQSRVDAKVTKREKTMQPPYMAQVTARYVTEPVDSFLFT